MAKIIRAAIKWREEHPEHVSGVPLVWNNKACVRKDNLRNPEPTYE